MVAFAGGVGGARLLRGVVRRLRPERLTAIVNTADDERVYGLSVSPDLDTIVYNLAGVAPVERGWGIDSDSTNVIGALERFYGPGWFGLGDRDLATNLFRTDGLRNGKPLHRITTEIAEAFGVRSRILPVSNDPIRTMVRTRGGVWLPFQTYFVRRGARDPVAGFVYRGLKAARPAPGVLAAIRSARAILIPPSNPFTSIRPILGVRGVAESLRRRRVPVVAVSPVSGGRALAGPLAQMLTAHRLPVSPSAIARLYRGFLDAIVIDRADEKERPALERLGLAIAVADVRMDTLERSEAVAEVTVALAREAGARF